MLDLLVFAYFYQNIAEYPTEHHARWLKGKPVIVLEQGRHLPSRPTVMGSVVVCLSPSSADRNPLALLLWRYQPHGDWHRYFDFKPALRSFPRGLRLGCPGPK